MKNATKTALVGGKKGLPSRRRNWPNTMAFPRELRDAIPEKCSGRVLELDSMHSAPVVTGLSGARVHLRLLVKETGKLTGQYVVLMELEPAAARGLAQTLLEVAAQVESQQQ